MLLRDLATPGLVFVDRQLEPHQQLAHGYHGLLAGPAAADDEIDRSKPIASSPYTLGFVPRPSLVCSVSKGNPRMSYKGT